ncbi:MAG: hypothetical protein ACR2NM_01670, partial [Bythopirellula sp.]
MLQLPSRAGSSSSPVALGEDATPPNNVQRVGEAHRRRYRYCGIYHRRQTPASISELRNHRLKARGDKALSLERLSGLETSPERLAPFQWCSGLYCGTMNNACNPLSGSKYHVA